jgi:methyl acetate hydrolase
MSELSEALDGVLQAKVEGSPRVPGVVAVVTNGEGNLYEGAAGERTQGGGEPMRTDSVFAVFSTTKAITGTVCLQLVEDGSLDLDAPAKEYVPALGEVQVLDGFDGDGQPVLRAPKRDITTRMLLLHTAGFGYDFFNHQYNRMATEHGQPSIIEASHRALRTPLLFDPGEQWEYGSNIDWAGQVVEGITGRRLGEVMADRVFAPLDMTETAFSLTPETRKRAVGMHARQADGSLSVMEGWELPQEPEVHMGGHGLYSTVPDYAKFLRMWLNDGEGPGGRVLAPETVRMAEQNHLGSMKIKGLPGVIPALSNDAEFFPGMPKSWALTFMINDEDAPTGRPAGSLAWAGLANLYYWIDRRNDLAGFWATQIFPFADAASVGGYLDLEAATYAALGVGAKAGV